MIAEQSREDRDNRDLTAIVIRAVVLFSPHYYEDVFCTAGRRVAAALAVRRIVSNSPCNQGPVADSKLSSGGKVTLPMPAMLPATVGPLAAFDCGIIRFIVEKTPHFPSSVVRLSVLRI